MNFYLIFLFFYLNFRVRNASKIKNIFLYAQIDPRLIFVTNYTENGTIFEEEISPLLLRFCSIHNELGDEFSIKEGINEESFDLTEEYYPKNLNIISMGRVGVGKSTGINEILQEYKTK